MDMRHVLLLMPFLLDGLLADEVEEYNLANPLGRISDPSYDGEYYCSALVMARVPPVSQTISCKR